MASGSRRDLELCDLTTSATRSSAVFATSPSALGHLDQERHRGCSPASPRNHQHSGIWVGVEPPPFRIHVVYCMRRFSAVLGSRSSSGFYSGIWVPLCVTSGLFLEFLFASPLGSSPGSSLASPGSSPSHLRDLLRAPSCIVRVPLCVTSRLFFEFLCASPWSSSPGSSLASPGSSS